MGNDKHAGEGVSLLTGCCGLVVRDPRLPSWALFWGDVGCVVKCVVNFAANPVANPVANLVAIMVISPFLVGCDNRTEGACDCKVGLWYVREVAHRGG